MYEDFFSALYVKSFAGRTGAAEDEPDLDGVRPEGGDRQGELLGGAQGRRTLQQAGLRRQDHRQGKSRFILNHGRV